MVSWFTRKTTSCNGCCISDMTFISDSMKLLATSGDGTVSVCNLRSNKIQTQSEFSEEERLSIVIMKGTNAVYCALDFTFCDQNGRKVVCGLEDGTLLLYSWGFFKDCGDRFTGLARNSIDATLLKLWDLEDQLQSSSIGQQNLDVESDSDEDQMDLDINPPKSKKGTKRKKC